MVYTRIDLNSRKYVTNVKVNYYLNKNNFLELEYKRKNTS